MIKNSDELYEIYTDFGFQWLWSSNVYCNIIVDKQADLENEEI